MRQEKRLTRGIVQYRYYIRFRQSILSSAPMQATSVLLVDRDLQITDVISPFDSISYDFDDFSEKCRFIKESKNACILFIKEPGESNVRLGKTYTLLSDLLSDTPDRLIGVFVSVSGKLYTADINNTYRLRWFSIADYTDLQLRCFLELSDKSDFLNYTYSSSPTDFSLM